jgi:hypothetical protein
MLQFTIRHALSQSLRFPLNPLLSQVSCDAPSQLSPPLTSRVAGRHGPQAALRKRTPSPARARAVPRAGAPRARAQPCRPSTSTPAPHAVVSASIRLYLADPESLNIEHRETFIYLPHLPNLACPPTSMLTSGVDATWGSWTTWSSWSTTCGDGNALRTRVCNFPSSLDSRCYGNSCPGSSNENRFRTAHLAVNGVWVSSIYLVVCVCMCRQRIIQLHTSPRFHPNPTQPSGIITTFAIAFTRRVPGARTTARVAA